MPTKPMAASAVVPMVWCIAVYSKDAEIDIHVETDAVAILYSIYGIILHSLKSEANGHAISHFLPFHFLPFLILWPAYKYYTHMSWVIPGEFPDIGRDQIQSKYVAARICQAKFHCVGEGDRRH